MHNDIQICECLSVNAALHCPNNDAIKDAKYANSLAPRRLTALRASDFRAKLGAPYSVLEKLFSGHFDLSAIVSSGDE